MWLLLPWWTRSSLWRCCCLCEGQTRRTGPGAIALPIIVPPAKDPTPSVAAESVAHVVSIRNPSADSGDLVDPSASDTTASKAAVVKTVGGEGSVDGNLTLQSFTEDDSNWDEDKKRDPGTIADKLKSFFRGNSSKREVQEGEEGDTLVVEEAEAHDDSTWQKSSEPDLVSDSARDLGNADAKSANL